MSPCCHGNTYYSYFSFRLILSQKAIISNIEGNKCWNRLGENGTLMHRLVGVKASVATLDINMDVSRNRSTTLPSYTTTEYITKGLHILWKKYSHIHVHSCVIDNNKDIESNYILIKWRIANENINMHNVILFSYTWNEIINFLNELITWRKIVMWCYQGSPIQTPYTLSHRRNLASNLLFCMVTKECMQCLGN